MIELGGSKDFVEDVRLSCAPGLVVSTNERLLLLCGRAGPLLANTFSAAVYLTTAGLTKGTLPKRGREQRIQPYVVPLHQNLHLQRGENYACIQEKAYHSGIREDRYGQRYAHQLRWSPFARRDARCARAAVAPRRTRPGWPRLAGARLGRDHVGLPALFIHAQRSTAPRDRSAHRFLRGWCGRRPLAGCYGAWSGDRRRVLSHVGAHDPPLVSANSIVPARPRPQRARARRAGPELGDLWRGLTCERPAHRVRAVDDERRRRGTTESRPWRRPLPAWPWRRWRLPW